MVAHSCNPSTQEAKERLCLKKTKQNKGEGCGSVVEWLPRIDQTHTHTQNPLSLQKHRLSLSTWAIAPPDGGRGRQQASWQRSFWWELPS
jgi:hypothetical protein